MTISRGTATGRQRRSRARVATGCCWCARDATGVISLSELKLFLGLAQNDGDVAVTGAQATDIFTANAHGLKNGQPIVLNSLTGGAGLTAGIIYWVITATTNTFQLSLTLGGSAVNFTTDLTAGFFNSITDPLLFQIEQQSVRIVEDYQHISYPAAATFVEFVFGVGTGELYLSNNPTADPTEVLE